VPAAATQQGAVLGVFFAVVLVAGFVGVFVLWRFVIRNAPPDGSDIGRAPDADDRDAP
jgi:hypothetical protein